MSVSNFELTVRLILSILLGGIIGMERETINKPAGFRTHILVCLGSTIVMLVYGPYRLSAWLWELDFISVLY